MIRGSTLSLVIGNASLRAAGPELIGVGKSDQHFEGGGVEELQYEIILANLTR